MSLINFTNRYNNLDKLAYFMNISFGLSLLTITLWFQFGDTKILLDNGQQISLGIAVISEPTLVVRIIEGIISLGLITLGIERLRSLKKK